MTKKISQKESGYFKKYYQDHKEENHKRHLDGYFKKYREDHKDPNKNLSLFYNDNKDLFREYHLLRNYNITLEEYNKLFLKQEGCCAICGKHQINFKHKLSVDHNHITGNVRGLLCHKCNVGVGYVDEDIKILYNMINYLQREIEALKSSNIINK